MPACINSFTEPRRPGSPGSGSLIITVSTRVRPSYSTRMEILAALGAFVGTSVLWDLAMVVALRSFGIILPFSFPFHYCKRRNREELTALKGQPEGRYILISGFLLFACPLFAGLTMYEYILRRFVDHSAIGVYPVVGSIVICAAGWSWGWAEQLEEVQTEDGRLKFAALIFSACCYERLRHAYPNGLTIRTPSISRRSCMSSEKSTLQPDCLAVRMTSASQKEKP